MPVHFCTALCLYTEININNNDDLTFVQRDREGKRTSEKYCPSSYVYIILMSLMTLSTNLDSETVVKVWYDVSMA